MKFISATYLHDGKRFLPNQSCLVVNDGRLIEVLHHLPNEDVEMKPGLLCPGLVNAHCHIELSYLHNLIPQKTGIVDFVLQINKIRNNFTDQEINLAIDKAERQMLDNGIVAVGDICNTTHSLACKSKKNIYYHSFIEAIGVFDNNASERFAFFENIAQRFADQGLNHSICAHAPYSVSAELFRSINAQYQKVASVSSIHNQESAAENELFMHGRGDFLKLYTTLFQDNFRFEPSHTSSLQYFLPKLNLAEKLILVHNTFTTAQDIQFAMASGQNVYWCTCPRANLYIEGRLPDNYPQLTQLQQKICIGTDSLASNSSLDIWAEVETIKHHFPEITYQELIQWASYNGAFALNIHQDYGLLEQGRKALFFHKPDFKSDIDL